MLCSPWRQNTWAEESQWLCCLCLQGPSGSAASASRLLAVALDAIITGIRQLAILLGSDAKPCSHLLWVEESLLCGMLGTDGHVIKGL